MHNIKSEELVASYWNSSVTRKEIQPVFDEMGSAINAHAVMLGKLDLIITFLAEKLGVTHEEVQAWTTAKLEQAKAEQANGANAPAEPSKIILE